MPHQQINGINIYYETKGEGEPLVFLHGLGSSTKDWETQVEEFSKTHEVITIDLRGHGRSEKPPGPYSIELFADDTSKLLKSLAKIPAHIVGLSMGSAVTFHLAIDHPEITKTITISNMSAEMPIKTWEQKKMYYARVLIVKLMGTRKMGKIIAENVFPKPAQQSLRALLENRWAGNNKKPYLSALSALKNWSILDRLGNIKCPTLVIHSENDYTPLEHKKEYAAKISNSKIVQIPDTGHIVNMEKPQEYNLVLKQFLNNQMNEET